MNQKRTGKHFDPSRLARVANEPNLSSLSAAIRKTNATPRLRIASLVGALCLGLILGLMFGGGTHGMALVLSGLGAALMVAVCLIADVE